MTSLHNIALGFSGSKTVQKFKVEDFVPNWMGTTDEPEDMSAENIKQFFMAFAESHNKRIDEDSQKTNTKRVKR